MGYPAAYRQTAVRPEISGFQRKSPGAVIKQFPSIRMDLKNSANGRLLNDLLRAGGEPGVQGSGVNMRDFLQSRRNKLVPRARTFRPFGLAQRQANQRTLLSAFRGGFRLRSYLFRALMSGAAAAAIELARRWLRNPGLSKHPLWTVTGRWGLYPYCSDATGAHALNSDPIHTSGPLVFGHPNGAFSWCEYDSVDKPTVGTWHFKVVGIGVRNAGQTGAAFYSGIQAVPWLPGYAPGLNPNPWKPSYNPWWNRFHWPQPIPMVDPWSPNMPMWEPQNIPIKSPWAAPTPMPVPFEAIPHRKPNAAGSGGQVTQRGPFTVRQPDPFGEPQPRDPAKPKEKPKTKPRITVRGPRKWRTHGFGGKPPTRYRDAKPPKRTKELKAKMLAARGSLVYRLMNGATEWMDYIDAIWKTLDKKYKSKGKLTALQKALDIFKNLDKIDIELAVKALVANEIQDLIFGLMGRVSARTAGKIGAPVDLHGRAMRKGQLQTRDAVNELVKLIMDGVFGTSLAVRYDPYWLHHGNT